MDDATLPQWVAAARAATPGVSHVRHFNHAGASLPSRRTLDAVVAHLELEATIGGYEAADAAADRVGVAASAIARLVGGAAHEVAIVDSATRAWHQAALAFPFRPGDRVLTGRAEYVSNVLGLLQLAQRRGVEVVVVDDDHHGQISLDALERELDRGAAMVALTHVPTNSGLVNPAAEVGARCRAHDAFFLLDACQSVGQLPVDVTALGCDALSATGRKFLRGPRGTGFLWVADRWIDRLESSVVDLHSARWVAPDRFEWAPGARRFELWERSVANVLGLGAAVEQALEVDVARAWPRIQSMGALLRGRLAEVPSVAVHDRGAVQGGIVTFSVAHHEATAVQALLRAQAITTSVSSVDAGLLDLAPRGLPDLVRASVHYLTTTQEIDALVAAVAAIASTP